jgi:MFS superfamily sulfate permease-like transporter
MLVPKLFTTLANYDRRQLFNDVTAGVIVGIVAIPLAIAFAIASGVTPGRGLWTAIVAGFIISALGGSRVQIGGPTGAFVVIVYGIVQKYGIDGLTVATLMAGVLLIIMGVAKLGSVIKFVPHPVITGFTSGIAVIIFSSQVKDLFGLRMGAPPAEFLPKWCAFIANAAAFTPAAAGLAGLALLIIVIWPRINQRIPGPFFFGAAETFRETLGQIAARPKVLVIRMRDVGALDSTGIHALKDVIHRTRRDGAAVLLADVHAQPLAALTASAVMDELGPGTVYPNIDDALLQARSLIGAAANAA